MTLAPAARLLPFMVKAAVAFEPEAVSVAEPSEVLPKVKVTLPVGAVLPDAGVSATDTCDVPLAVAVSVVATIDGAVTVTVAEPVDPAKAAAPA